MKPNTVGFTAVLADDEELILKRLEESVNWEELNIQLVSLAQNGKQALEAILTFKPDLAVIDIRMPEISGLEVIQRSRNAGIQTDFIILSGYDDFSYAQEAIRYGARAYLLKPVNSSELYDEIYRICLEHSRRKGPRISRLYQNKLNVSFFNKLIDSKILEPGIIQQILSSTELNISDSPCYVCVIQFDDDIPKKKPPLSADELTADIAGDPVFPGRKPAAHTNAPCLGTEQKTLLAADRFIDRKRTGKQRRCAVQNRLSARQKTERQKKAKRAAAFAAFERAGRRMTARIGPPQPHAVSGALPIRTQHRKAVQRGGHVLRIRYAADSGLPPLRQPAADQKPVRHALRGRRLDTSPQRCGTNGHSHTFNPSPGPARPQEKSASTASAVPRAPSVTAMRQSAAAV